MLRKSEQEQAWIQQNSKIIVGKEVDWPPFNFSDSSGNQQGISIDFLRLIANKTGMTFEFSEPLSYAQMHTLLATGDIDVIAAICKRMILVLRKLLLLGAAFDDVAPQIMMSPVLCCC